MTDIPSEQELSDQVLRELYEKQQAESELAEEAIIEPEAIEEANEEAALTEVIDGQTYYTPEAQKQSGTWNPAQETAEGMTELGKQSVLGVIDTALGLSEQLNNTGVTQGMGALGAAARLGSAFRPTWDKSTSRLSEQPHQQAIRKIAGIVIPVMATSGASSAALSKLPAFASLGTKTKLAARVGLEMGVDATITGASTSATDENFGQMLNENFGWHVPWATKNSDSTEVKYWKNYFENASLAGAGEVLGLLFGFNKGTKGLGIEYKPKTPEAAEKLRQLDEVDEAVVRSLEADPAEYTGVARGKAIREAAVEAETVARLEADPLGEKGYDSFINQGDDTARALPNQDVDGYAAVVDTATIDKYPTLNQRPAPMVTRSFQRKFMQAADSSERAEGLHEVFVRMPKQIDAIRDGKKVISEEDMTKSVNKLASTILGTDVKTFAKDIDQLKNSIINGQKFLDDDSFVMLSKAFKEAFDTIYDPNNVRASAMMVQQAAFDVSDAARVANDLDNYTDVTRQTEIAFENLELVASELRANQYIAGYSLEMKKLVKNTNHFGTAEKLRNHRDTFEAALAAKRAEGSAVIEEYKRIARDHPEYRRAFTKAFDATNGDIDTLDKLFKFAEQNLGIVKKGIIDKNPETPSLILQGLQGVRYNNILNGLAPARAATGSAIMITARAISAFMGSAPALATGDTYLMKRALYTFGGFMENFHRGLDVMRKDWATAVTNPNAAMARGRKDLQFKSLDNLEILDSMKDGWRQEGKTGKVALTNFATMLSHWNNLPIARWGVNAMFAIDGFTNSFMASGNARAQAYDALFESTNGAFKQAEFDKMQRALYSKAFDANGVLTDQAAKHAAGEIALNLDSNTVKALEGLMDKFPVTKALFMFPRTGVNALKLGWTFNPISNLLPAMDKAQLAMKAVTDSEIIDTLIDHGIAVGTTLTRENRIAHKALKSEYVGRQLMGTVIVSSVGLAAFTGHITGNGPQDRAELRRMIAAGWKPLSFKIPFTNQWISYKGIEPFQSLMGLTADMVYQGTRVDQAPMEDFYNKVVAAIGMNITNQTFLSQFEPLVALLSGDKTAIARFSATQVDSIIPGTGMRSIASNIITPQLKDIERDFAGYLANRNKWMFNSDDKLKDYLDLYTGEPIKYFDPILSRVNAVLPFFKMNGGMEPWRQWMLETGWDGLNVLRTNPEDGEPLEPQDAQWINNWIAKNYPLAEKVEAMRTQRADWWSSKIKEYKKARGMMDQKDFPIKKFVVDQELNRIHNKAFKAAWNAYAASHQQAVRRGALKKHRDEQLKRGDIEGAKKTVEQIIQIRK